MEQNFIFPPAVWAAFITTAFTGIFALLGVIYNSLTNSIKENTRQADDVETRLAEVENKVKTLFGWAFGNDRDQTDRGISEDIDDGLNELNTKMDTLESKSEDRHDEVMENIRTIVEVLHDEEAVDFDRDDIE